jgi:hypothetical protein
MMFRLLDTRVPRLAAKCIENFELAVKKAFLLYGFYSGSFCREELIVRIQAPGFVVLLAL